MEIRNSNFRGCAFWKCTCVLWICIFVLIGTVSPGRRHDSHEHDDSRDEDDDRSRPHSDEIACTPPWKKVHRSCVRFEKDTFLTWHDAQNDCINKGGNLLSVNDRKEMDKVRPQLKKLIKSEMLLNWWVGMKLVKSHEQRWEDGTLYHRGIPPWIPGHPEVYDPSIPEKCVQLNYQNYLNDTICNISRPYICEEDKATSPPTTSTAAVTTTTTSTTATAAASTASTSTSTSTANSTSTSTTTSRPTRTDKLKTDKPSKRTKPTKRPTIPPETTPATEEVTTKPTPVADEFRGCYAVNYEKKCPPVVAFGISWPRTEAGKMAKVQCEKGHATWKCDKKPTCWKHEPNIKACTSENIQDLADQVDDMLENPENSSDKAVAFTENLAATLDTDDTLSEQDLFQSTKLMDAAAQAMPNNASSAKNIIKNVLKCGSSLVSSNKQTTWSGMKQETKRTIASSLIGSMESVSNKMVKAFDVPTVERIVEDNMAIELRVMSVDELDQTDSDVVYEGEDNSFSIPPENLRQASQDGLARFVVISYKNVGELLKPNIMEGESEKELVSQVLSASLGQEANSSQSQPKPILFTFNTEQRKSRVEWKQLCSFWNFSLGYTGAWSQEGCSLQRYNSTHTTCRCTHLTNFAILMDIHKTKVAAVHSITLSYITYAGIIISIICLFLSWVTFMCLGINCMRHSGGSYARSNMPGYETYPHSSSGTMSGTSSQTRAVQGERNSIHKHLVFCLFVAEVLFLVGIERTDEKVVCSIIAGCLHYFFLASFVWMFIEGIHILFMLVQVFDTAKSRLKYYYCIGYGVPLAIVGISAAVFHEGYGTVQYCWLTTEKLFIWSFAGPVAFILTVNLVILVYAMTAVCKHSEYVFTKEKSTVGSIKFVILPPFVVEMKERVKKQKGWVQGALAIEVLLGLTWVFGYFYISEEALVTAYLFTVFNSLQGLFIFIFHCILNKKVRKEYERFIEYRKAPSTTATTHSKSGVNGSGSNTGSYPLTNSRKTSTASRKASTGFTDINRSNGRHGSSSTA